jgi:hypothetical protein
MEAMNSTLARLVVVASLVAGALPGQAAAAAAPETPAASSVVGTSAPSAIVPGSVNRSSLALSATYAVSATVAVSTGVINVTTTIVARNDSGQDIDRVELNTIAPKLGAMTLTSATVDATPVTVTVSDQTLKVPLGGILPSGASVEVRIGYRATLRNSLGGSNWMWTRYGGTLALYRWIPWVSATRPFGPDHGDPFVTPTSPHVHVDLSLDKAMVLATPANITRTAASKTWSIGLDNVRDVSMVLAPDFTVTKRSVNGVAIRAYSRPGGVSGSKLADLARAALSKEAARIGVAYPWPNLTVIETKGGVAMESPRAIWIPGNSASSSLTYLVYHETAHQWFYGLVGNDQSREPFADEAAADMLARTVLGSLRSSHCASDELDRGHAGYSSSCYYEVIYIQGANFLNRMRDKMGTTRFWNAMKGYVQANRFKLAGTKKLLDALRAASPVDITPNLEARFPTLY